MSPWSLSNRASYSYESTVLEVARNMDLLDPAGALNPLDSLTIVDLVVQLESVLDVEIPIVDLTPDVFVSIESIATMLARIEG